MSALLQVQDLHVTYRSGREPVPAVRGVDFALERGQTLALVGESGSGKSTLARSVLGLHKPTTAQAGSVTFAQTELLGLRPRGWSRLRGRRISLVPQDPLAGLNPVQTIGAQVAEVLIRHRVVPRAQVRSRVVEALREVGLDDAERRLGAYPHELSGGQRQRVLIAIAIIARPDLIVADEPTSALDVTVQRQILDRLEVLVREAGAALVLVTHDLGVASDRADRIAVMEAGKIVEELPGRSGLASARHPYTVRLAAAAPSLGARPLVAAPTVVSATAGERAPAVAAARSVTVEFPARRGGAAVRALDEVSVSVGTGESVGVVGESGSGKTTLARVLLGLQEAQSGEVEVLGGPLPRTRAGRRVLHRAVQPVFQDPYSSLDPKRSVAWSIAEPLRALTDLDARARRARVGELMDQVALPATTATRRPTELSGGQLQRVAIARALAVSPRLLLCDEPVSALDVSIQDQVLRLLARLHQEGLAMLFISHDLAVVRLICTRVVVMRAGRVVEEGAVGQVLERPEHPYTRELLDAVPGRRVLA